MDIWNLMTFCYLLSVTTRLPIHRCSQSGTSGSLVLIYATVCLLSVYFSLYPAGSQNILSLLFHKLHAHCIYNDFRQIGAQFSFVFLKYKKKKYLVCLMLLSSPNCCCNQIQAPRILAKPTLQAAGKKKTLRIIITLSLALMKQCLGISNFKIHKAVIYKTAPTIFRSQTQSK